MCPMKLVFASLLASLVALAACDSESTSTDPTPTDPNDPEAGSLVLASGVEIKEVAIYQSLKRTIAKDGGSVFTDTDIPLVEGRDAMIRVFFETSGDYDGEAVTGRLIINDGEAIVTEGKLYGPSTDGNIASSVNFFVPGDLLTGTSFTYSVKLMQQPRDGASPSALARFPLGADPASVAFDAPRQTFRVVLAPLRYDYDGSGRVPDTSDEALAVYRERLRQIFPVSDVELILRGPQPWDDEIGPDGTGWQEIIEDTIGFRAVDGTPADYYYYAIFNPEPSFNEYCGFGCLLGLTLLNDQPQDRGQPLLRIAAGIGYEGYGPDTMAHELGHAHGREHAPCGGPDGVDPNFPHAGGKIGTWGLDPATGATFDPSITTDIMGYCDFSWVSDYTYKALLDRGTAVNLPKWEKPATDRAVMLSLSANGDLTWGHTVEIPRNLAGRRLPARVREFGGAPRALEATVLTYDHLPGGIVLVPNVSEGVSEVEVSMPERTVVVRRPQ